MTRFPEWVRQSASHVAFTETPGADLGHLRRRELRNWRRCLERKFKEEEAGCGFPTLHIRGVGSISLEALG